MNSRSLVPAVLLLTLSAPPSHGGALRLAQRSRASATCTSVASKQDEFSPSSIRLAGEYLRQSARKLEPSRDSRNAWTQFQPTCDSTIRAFAARFFKTPPDIDDCTQEVWIDLIRNLPEFNFDQNRGQFSSWLFTIVRNKAADMVRRQVRRAAEPLVAAAFDKPDLSTEDPSRSLARKLDVQSVRDALALLRAKTSDENYRILHLRHVEGREVADVAAELGISSHQVWSREHRMKRKLREILAISEYRPLSVESRTS